MLKYSSGVPCHADQQQHRPSQHDVDAQVHGVRRPPQHALVHEELLDEQHFLHDVDGLVDPVDLTRLRPPFGLLQVRAAVGRPPAAFLGNGIEVEARMDLHVRELVGFPQGQREETEHRKQNEHGYEHINRH